MAKGLGGGHFGTQHCGESDGLAQSLATPQNIYAPRPLITLTVGVATKRYSTETLETP